MYCCRRYSVKNVEFYSWNGIENVLLLSRQVESNSQPNLTQQNTTHKSKYQSPAFIINYANLELDKATLAARVASTTDNRQSERQLNTPTDRQADRQTVKQTRYAWKRSADCMWCWFESRGKPSDKKKSAPGEMYKG